MKKTLTTAALLALGTLSTNAAITYGGSFTEFASTSSSNHTINWDASSYDKLVVVATAEHGHSNTNGVISNVTYDGVALTKAVGFDPVVGNITYNSIWYLDDPSTSAGDIVTTGANRLAFTAFGLNGTATGHAATADAAGTSVSLASSASSMVITSLGSGGNGNTQQSGATPTGTMTNINGSNFSSWGGHSTSYGAGGQGIYGYNGNADGADVIAVEFTELAAIPEPSSAALLGLGGLALIMRRRK